jgi:tRNA nucleotidyltransferase (CCA-adding enzyme)
MLKTLGAFKSGSDANLKKFLLACEADARGRTGMENRPYPQVDFILAAQKIGMPISISSLPEQMLSGEKIGLAIHKLRIKAISACKKDFQTKLKMKGN